MAPGLMADRPDDAHRGGVLPYTHKRAAPGSPVSTGADRLPANSQFTRTAPSCVPPRACERWGSVAPSRAPP